MTINHTLLLITIISICSCSEPKPKYNCEDLATLEKLASEDNHDAQVTLGTCYQKAADGGDAYAQVNLGVMYEYGQGVDKDLPKAVEFYQKAANQGYARAQTNLGVMYEYGQGVDKDLMKAIEFYQKAANQGHADAQNNLGVMYEYGQGVDKDLIKALEFYQKAADQGHELAKKNLQNKSLQIAIPFGLKIGKERFDNLLEGLDAKYNSSYKRIPYVGDKKARFIAVNGVIELEAIHLLPYTALYFNTNEFESLLRNGIQTEQLLKKQKEESML